MGATRRVFLSHTGELDRWPEGRTWIEAAASGVRQADMHSWRQADFTASDRPAAAECETQVRSSDVYVGVLGFRYGTPVRERPEVSYTELEFETAGSQALPRLLFLLDEEVEGPRRHLVDPLYGGRQSAFRARVQEEEGKTVRFVRDPVELERKVMQALYELPAESRPAPAARETVFDVEVLDPTWSVERGPAMRRPDYRYRLDALIAKTAGPFTAILGDPRQSGAHRPPLVNTLNAVEKFARPGPSTGRRRWFALATEELGAGVSPERIVEHLDDAEGWGDACASGASIGLVVPVAAASFDEVDAGRGARVRSTLDWLRRALPRAALVVHAVGATPVDAAGAAAAIAGAPGSSARFTALLWSPARAATSEGVSIDGLADVDQEIGSWCRRRRLPWSAWSGSGGATPSDEGCDATGVPAGTGTRPLTPAEQVELLRRVAAVYPERIGELVVALAATEDRWCSLQVAAEIGELATWADGAPWHLSRIDPRQLPVVHRSFAVVEAVALELMGLGAPEHVVDPWVAVGPLRLRTLRAHTEPDSASRWRPLSTIAHVDDETAVLVARAAVRCGWGEEDLLPAARQWPVFWAVAVRSEATPSRTALLDGLPLHLRAVADGRDPDDNELEGIVSHLRRQLPHLATNGAGRAR